ncbi:hypothetical protein [Simplicispira suum]|uniref:hypothetical protein n=1 Tax=Simplicispira suum TaxID=2109915 RepID=UPI001B801314|nr:hypothetical protein [Simplicispira suum]MBW7834471.1 hypothetical protein [Simplicispira suum]
MHLLRTAAVLFAAATLGQAANAACYLVYAPDGTVVYRSVQSPVDLSKPLHLTLPQAAPGGRLVFSLDNNGCELEVHKLDTLHSRSKSATRPTSPARKARGA